VKLLAQPPLAEALTSAVIPEERSSSLSRSFLDLQWLVNPRSHLINTVWS
jgi:hypothetical protein